MRGLARTFVVFMALGSFACGPSSSTSATVPTTPTPVPVAFGCPAVPPTPSPYPPSTRPFSLTFNPDPLWVGLVGPLGDRNQITFKLDINVDATSALRGSITKVHRVLRDRATGQVLGDLIDSGPFTYFGNTPCRSYDPLLLYGHENLTGSYLFRGYESLGFQQHPAILSVDVTLLDTAGGTWIVSKSVAWDLLPPPTPRTPVNTTVRQNDPASGCTFDPVHGYGVVLDLGWDPPVAGGPISWYGIDAYDGVGGRLYSGVTSTDETTLHRKRITLCNTHLDSGANRSAKWAVTATTRDNVPSDYGVANFDFESCRDAGVPACH